MIEELKSVKLGKKEYRIKCDINVLIVIQEYYDSINMFELDIVGVNMVKDENGVPVKDENGEMKFTRRQPSLKAIKNILPAMIAEGDENADIKEVKEAIKDFDFDLYDVSIKMYEEFSRCFKRKNE